MNDPEVQEGIELLESIWYLNAISIVELAIKTYKLSNAQADALKDVFLKQNDYYVVIQK
jgi:hypothetical protein